MKESNAIYALAGAIIVAALILGFSGGTTVGDLTLTQSEEHALSVVGTGTVSADPDEATVYIGVETEAKTASAAVEENAQKMSAVKSSVLLLGVKEKDISTSTYRIYPVRDYELRNNAITGYKVTHTLKVKTENVDGVGKIIDSAVSAGSNSMGNIHFGLRDETMQEFVKDALKLASENAKDKAISMARGSGVSLGRVISVSEGTSYTPVYRNYGVALAESVPASTSLDPGEVQVSAVVAVAYQIG